jgi:hypothetical protein
MKRNEVPVPDKTHDLVTCGTHGVVFMLDDKNVRHCPCCELDVEGRPSEYKGGRIGDMEFRDRAEWSTTRDLVPLMRAYLADKKMGPMWISCVSWRWGPMPAGYNETERFINVISYQWGSMVKYIITDHDARRTVETLTKAGYAKDAVPSGGKP